MPDRVIPGAADVPPAPPIAVPDVLDVADETATPAVADGQASDSRRAGMPWQVKFGALALIWGSSFLLMKYALRWFAPIQIATGRILFGAVTVTLLLHVLGGRLPRSRRVWAHLLVVGLLLASLPFTLFPLGEERVASALAGIGNATTPMATVLATAAMLPAERLPGRKVVAVVVGFLGVLVIAQPWQTAGRPDLLGFGFTLVAGASYGVGWTWVRKHLAKEDLGGLQLPAALLVVASAQMVVVVLVWWVLHRGAVAAPWSPGGRRHRWLDAAGAVAAGTRRARHGDRLPAAVRRREGRGTAGRLTRDLRDPDRLRRARLPPAGRAARRVAARGRRPRARCRCLRRRSTSAAGAGLAVVRHRRDRP